MMQLKMKTSFVPVAVSPHIWMIVGPRCIATGLHHHYITRKDNNDSRAMSPKKGVCKKKINSALKKNTDNEIDSSRATTTTN